MESNGTLGAALPGYEIGEELGRGGFGVVVAGRHRQLHREVAIKQLPPTLMSNQSARSRFLSEARVLASIDHPHVVPVYDYVEHEDTCILVMERLAGGTVWQHFVDQGFDQPTACAIALAVCSGLHGAHQHGILHRDIKPENVLFGTDHSLKVTDFGIAQVLGRNDVLASPSGELLGTPAYMAPEQASGTDLGPATDVYAAGVMLFELLSGQLPYREDGGSLAIVLRHINETATPLTQVAPAVPSALADVTMRALAAAPADRFESAEEFGVAIGTAAGGAWGSDWLERTGISLRDTGSILVSAKAAPVGAVPADTHSVVRPAIEVHVGAGAGRDLALDDLMPLRRRSLEMPPFPSLLVWVAAGLTLVMLVLGLFGVGSSPPRPQLGPGVVAISGHDPTAGPVPLDLDHNIPIVLHQLSPAATPATAQIVLSFGGVTIVRSTTVPLVRTSNGWFASVDASIGRYVVGGKLSGSLRVDGAHGGLVDDFPAQAQRSPFLTFGGLIGIVLLLVVASYAESLLRVLRRGYRKATRASVVGMVIVGIFAGVTTAIWSWMLGISSPTWPGYLIPMVVGAGAGLVAALAAVRMGHRARVRRRSNRLVLVAHRSAPVGGAPSPTGRT